MIAHAPDIGRTRYGGRTPVARELTVGELPFSGRIPAELDGCFLHIGPNPLYSRDPARHHVFAGDGMVHGVRIRGGRPEWYRNRWIRSDHVCRARGELPVPGPRFGLSDNANVNVIRHGGRVLALGEAGVLPAELDGGLDTVARHDFDGTLPGGFTGHPQLDPVTGELFALTYYHEPPYVRYIIVDTGGRVRRAEPISVKTAPMIHTLSLTERHVVFYDLSVTFSPQAVAAGHRFPYTWDPSHGARIGISPREGTDADVRWLELDHPCYVFHPVNAYEDGHRIVIDVIRHERVFDSDLLYPGESAPTLWRWMVDHTQFVVREEQISEEVEEFPRIDERRSGMPHRYTYSVGVLEHGAGVFAGRRLFKRDAVGNRVQAQDFGPGRYAGEGVFVPREPYCAEDDGWVLTYVYDATAGRSDLVVLEAADFAGPPSAVIHLPGRVPDGFHSSWIGPRGELDRAPLGR